jgi:hypothetical protein
VGNDFGEQTPQITAVLEQGILAFLQAEKEPGQATPGCLFRILDVQAAPLEFRDRQAQQPEEETGE